MATSGAGESGITRDARRSRLLLAAAAILAVPLLLGATAASAFELRLSTAPDRSSSVALAGAQVSGLIYVFVAPEPGLTQVRFFVNDPTMAGTPRQTERSAPWDLAGTASNGTAIPFDASLLPAGANTITAALTLTGGGTETLQATFEVVGGGSTYALVVSADADRSNPVPLDGSTQSGSFYAFVSPAAGIARVRFFVDDPDMSGAPRQVENSGPWDLAGTASNGLALPFDASQLPAGSNTITAALTLSGGGTEILQATFEVGGGGSTYALVVSADADRSNPVPLDGSTQSGSFYAFVSPAAGIARVRFFVDDPDMSGAPRQVENSGPWDLAGTASGGGANPFSTTGLGNGPHTVTAAIDRIGGGTTVATATFTVANQDTPTLVLSPDVLALTAPEGGTTSGSLNLNTTAGTTTFSVQDDAPWLTVQPSSGSTPGALTATANASGLTAGTHTGTITATAPGYTSDTATVTFTVEPGGGGGGDCFPLACEDILVDLPYELGFDQDHGKILDGNGIGTGFTYVDLPSQGAGYVPGRIAMDLATGTLQLTTSAGLAYRGANAQDNALGVGIDAPSQVTLLTTSLIDPPPGTGKFEQAGLWFGNDEDNYVKLTVLSTTSGPRIEFLLEVGGQEVSKRQTSPGSLAGRTVTLRLRTTPTTRQITAFFQLDQGPMQTVATFTAPAEFFSFDAAGIDPRIGTRSFGGIFASHRNGPAPLTYTFGHFSVVADTSTPPGGGGPGGSSGEDFGFDRTSFSVPNPTAMVWGPDDRLYVTEMLGKIHAITLDENKQVVSRQIITTLGSRLTLGIAVDPFSTPSNVVLWVAHSSPSLTNGAANSSVISRLSGTNFATRQDVITGLPRAIANHAVNSIRFGPDGRLYIAQAGNTGAGAPNTANTEFFTRPEQPLSAALLVADVYAPGFQGNCASPVDDTTGTASKVIPASCHVQVYASGLRNIYDFVHHSNGQIYAPDNGLGVRGTFPVRPTPDCQGIVSYSTAFDPGEQPDTLVHLEAGKYYGHPNPARDECVFGDGTAQGVAPLPNWTPGILNLGNNRSANGTIEYTGDHFCGDLRGEILIANYSVGDDITRVRLSEDGRSVASAGQLTGGFNNPLPLAMGPDGTIYVGEHGGNKVTALIPRHVGCWTPQAPLPVALLDAGGAALGGKLYVVGGKTSAGHQSRMYVYDPVANAWTVGPDLPGPAVENPAVVAFNGRLYAFGGSTSPFAGSVTNAAVYDPTTNAWTTLAPMPLGRAGAAAQVLNNRIYVVGGMNAGASLDSVAIYDPATNTWSAGPPMSTRRDNPGAAVLGGKLYVFGGRTRNADGTTVNGTLNTVEMFDPATGTWTPRAPMPTGRRTMVVGTLNGRAQVMGGEAAPNNQAFKQNEEYDPATDSWTTLRSMLTPRHGAAAGTIGDVVYVAGGGPQAGTAFTNVNEAFSLAEP